MTATKLPDVLERRARSPGRKARPDGQIKILETEDPDFLKSQLLSAWTERDEFEARCDMLLGNEAAFIDLLKEQDGHTATLEERIRGLEAEIRHLHEIPPTGTKAWTDLMQARAKVRSFQMAHIAFKESARLKREALAIKQRAENEIEAMKTELELKLAAQPGEIARLQGENEQLKQALNQERTARDRAEREHRELLAQLRRESESDFNQLAEGVANAVRK